METNLTKITEGETLLYVPASSLTRREPDTAPLFFNPAARLNRDISVAITGAIGKGRFCDSLSGIGARGIRIAKESSKRVEVTLNDFNSSALSVARRNARINSVLERCEFNHGEVNHFLYSRFGRDEKFDFVEVDPFGSPAPFLQAAFAASADDAIVSVTATDTAVLCGVYPRVAYRRYGSISTKSGFSHETGIRILLHFCSRVAAINDIGIEPVAAHSTRHYIRVYMRAVRSTSAADRSLTNFGYVAHCTSCGENQASDVEERVCQACGSKAQSSGPLWTGSLVYDGILTRAQWIATKKGYGEACSTLHALEKVDAYPPFSYDLEDICSRLRIPSVPAKTVIEKLASSGYSWTRQPFEKSGLKTDAPYSEVVGAVRSASSSVA